MQFTAAFLTLHAIIYLHNLTRMTPTHKVKRTHLVVDGLCGWGGSQRLVDPSSGVESHGPRGLALGPEVLGEHTLLIVEVLHMTDKQTNS